MKNLIMSVCAALAAVIPAQLLAQTTPAQTEPDLEALCASTACRSGGHKAMIAIDAAKHLYTDVPVGQSPYVTPDGAILIFPGEALLFQFDGDADKPGEPKFVRAYAASSPARVDIDGKLADHPANAALPAIPQKGGTIDYSALPANSLLVDYGQVVKDDSSMMMMVIDGTFGKVLKFDATMYVPRPGKGGYDKAYTSTCPVHPKAGVFETWPHAIGPIFLDEFRFVSADQTACD